ncbi:hypothetical protein TNCV_4799321 [Trichonephila clavipes]|nr:hypothetical protein TNCV_4799321 [Trichonephila clavipes]
MLSRENLSRIHLTTRQDIKNIKRSFGLTNQRHADDATSVRLMLEEMAEFGTDPFRMKERKISSHLSKPSFEESNNIRKALIDDDVTIPESDHQAYCLQSQVLEELKDSNFSQPEKKLNVIIDSKNKRIFDIYHLVISRHVEVLLHVKSIEAQTSSHWCGVEVKTGVPAQVSSSSLDHGSKLRVPQQPMRAKTCCAISVYVTLDADLREQMLRSCGQYDAKLPVFSSKASMALIYRPTERMKG